jgi:hypothetical protein
VCEEGGSGTSPSITLPARELAGPRFGTTPAGFGGLHVLRWNCRKAMGTSASVEHARGTPSKVAPDAEWLPWRRPRQNVCGCSEGACLLHLPSAGFRLPSHIAAAPAGSKSIAGRGAEGGDVYRPATALHRLGAGAATPTVWPYFHLMSSPSISHIQEDPTAHARTDCGSPSYHSSSPRGHGDCGRRLW